MEIEYGTPTVLKYIPRLYAHLLELTLWGGFSEVEDLLVQTLCRYDIESYYVSQDIEEKLCIGWEWDSEKGHVDDYLEDVDDSQ
jgi:hypothetical protein